MIHMKYNVSIYSRQNPKRILWIYEISVHKKLLVFLQKYIFVHFAVPIDIKI